MLLETRDLALYGSLVGTANGVWALYNGVYRDRPRVRIIAYEGVEMYEQELRAFMLNVRNRGRRDLHVGHLWLRNTRSGTRGWVREVADAVDAHRLIGGDQSHTYQISYPGYEPGELPKRRWFLEDDTGRIYPLHERYRQRIEDLILWPLRKIDSRRER